MNECCPENATESNYCFKWVLKDLDKKVIILKKIINNYYCYFCQKISKIIKNSACLPARYVTDKRPCTQNSDCFTVLSRHESSCVMPVWDNSTKLIRILLDKDKKPILYVGSIKELIYSSKYIGCST